MKFHPAEGEDITNPEMHRPQTDTRGGSNPWGWARGRGASGLPMRPDPIEHYTVEHTPIPADHPSQAEVLR